MHVADSGYCARTFREKGRVNLLHRGAAAVEHTGGSLVRDPKETFEW